MTGEDDPVSSSFLILTLVIEETMESWRSLDSDAKVGTCPGRLIIHKLLVNNLVDVSKQKIDQVPGRVIIVPIIKSIISDLCMCYVPTYNVSEENILFFRTLNESKFRSLRNYRDKLVMTHNTILLLIY